MHGTIYEERDGRLARIVDRTGAVHAELTWRAAGDLLGERDPDPERVPDLDRDPDPVRLASLVRLAVANAAVDGAVITHPLLGAAHLVGDTAMSALSWAHPTEIPAIAEPGRLPLGAGAAILNTIAVLAQRAGVSSLRYAGPYPTTALWRTLARSFRCGAGEAEFTAGGLDRALRVARDPIAIDFVPAPHERIAIAGGFVELRDQIERVVIDGVAYEPGGSPARLVGGHPCGAHEAREPSAAHEAHTAHRTREPSAAHEAHTAHRTREPSAAHEAHTARDLSATRTAHGAREPSAAHEAHTAHGAREPSPVRHCEIWFGDAPYARVATLAPDGSLLAGPRAIPRCESSVLDREFPLALRIAIAELVAEAVPAPLAADARELCAAQGLRWADLGARAAREQADGFAVHAALWERIAPLGLGRLALALAEALAPVVTAAVVRRAVPGAARRTSDPAA